jgi:threonine synthase
MDGLICIQCGKKYPLQTRNWKCVCGGLLDLSFKARFPLKKIASRPPDLWRYREALPLLEESCFTSLGESLTALLTIPISNQSVQVKQDQLFPTGSYKDRGAAVLISHAREIGITDVVEDSSGNAGCAIAAYCARAGIGCDIYVPESTSPAKLVQIERYGAELHRIPGSREDTARAVLTAADGTYYASHSWNPFFFHGTKTWAYEVCEQRNWQAPEAVVLPAGNGTLLLGAWLGFNDLALAGVIDRLPRIIVVQSAGCAALAVAFRRGASEPDLAIPRYETMAEGIAIAEPIRGKQILAAVRASRGEFLTVTEAEIQSALMEMCLQGFFIEPTAAATIAGVKQFLLRPHDETEIVTTFTGHGLKAVEKLAHMD